MFFARASSGRKRFTMAVLGGLLGASAATVKGDGFFDWGQGTTPINPAYTPVIAVSDANVAQVQAFLQAQKTAGLPLAVKINSGVTLSANTVNQVFNNGSYGPVKYVFADYEGPNAISQTTTLVSQIAPTSTGASIVAGTSFVGNFGLAPIPAPDPTAPASSNYPSGNSAANPYSNAIDFRNSGVNMATESLYPGDASFRNPVNGNSTAPNIRSAMFVLPIQRLSITTNNMGANQANIPYVSRFNNFSNSAMANSTFANPQGFIQNAFNTAGATINGQSVSGQLLSRNDFQAMMLHYRMRGASGYQLLDPGVVGYTPSDYENDAQAGWNNALINSVMSGVNGRVASLPTTINVNGLKQTFEQAGTVYSAVTNDAPAGQPGLAILVSNLSPNAEVVSFGGNRINGATLQGASSSTAVAAGGHMILRFTKSGGVWAAFGGGATPAFNDPTLASRDGIGIPEPTSLSLLGIGALGVLARRRRKA